MTRKIFVYVLLIALLTGAAAMAQTQERYLLSPDSAEQIEDFFLQFKPQPEFRMRNLQPKNLKGIRDRLADDDASLAEDLPKIATLIHFDFDSAQIRPESHAELEKFAAALQGRLQDALVMIFGHTDSVGAEAYNWDLSKRRALAVKEFLAARHGIDAQRLIVKPYGPTKPLAANDSAENRALNRRVEFACIW